MRHNMELVGRAPDEPRLETEFDEKSKEHVFALKRNGEILSVARLEKVHEPLECFYLRRIETDMHHRGHGYAATLLQEITDIFREQGDMCVAYRLSNAKVVALFEGSGWRPLSIDKEILTLNVPLEDERKALQLIDSLTETGGL